MSYYIILKALGVAVGVVLLVFFAIKYAYLYMKNTLIIVGILAFTACLGYDIYKIYYPKDNQSIAKSIKKDNKNLESRSDLRQYVLENTEFKDNTVNYNVDPKIDMAMVMVIASFRAVQGDNAYKPVITSANDYNGHKNNSLHYKGKAVDIRVKDISDEKRNDIAEVLRLSLGPGYIVLHEDKGNSNEHLHIQVRDDGGTVVATDFDGII